jgi:hypothetical protein
MPFTMPTWDEAAMGLGLCVCSIYGIQRHLSRFLGRFKGRLLSRERPKMVRCLGNAIAQEHSDHSGVKPSRVPTNGDCVMDVSCCIDARLYGKERRGYGAGNDQNRKVAYDQLLKSD